MHVCEARAQCLSDPVVSADEIFTVVNVMPLPIWAVWIFAPRSALARWLAASWWPWATLACIYVATLAVALVHEPSGSFSSLAGVMALFDSRWGALAGWVHYLCFDLFVGRWMVNDAPEAGYRLAGPLFLALMAGPAGLLTYLAGRAWFQRQ